MPASTSKVSTKGSERSSHSSSSSSTYQVWYKSVWKRTERELLGTFSSLLAANNRAFSEAGGDGEAPLLFKHHKGGLLSLRWDSGGSSKPVVTVWVEEVKGDSAARAAQLTRAQYTEELKEIQLKSWADYGEPDDYDVAQWLSGAESDEEVEEEEGEEGVVVDDGAEEGTKNTASEDREVQQHAAQQLIQAQQQAVPLARTTGIKRLRAEGCSGRSPRA